MVEELFELFDSLVERQRIIDNILKKLGGHLNEDFLFDEVQKVELLIVKALGGNEGHYAHIDSTELFYTYKNCDKAVAADEKNELIDYIKLTIENGWTEDVGSIFRRA